MVQDLGYGGKTDFDASPFQETLEEDDLQDLQGINFMKDIEESIARIIIWGFCEGGNIITLWYNSMIAVYFIFLFFCVKEFPCAIFSFMFIMLCYTLLYWYFLYALNSSTFVK